MTISSVRFTVLLAASALLAAPQPPTVNRHAMLPSPTAHAARGGDIAVANQGKVALWHNGQVEIWNGIPNPVAIAFAAPDRAGAPLVFVASDDGRIFLLGSDHIKEVASGRRISALATGDFNRDGIADLAVAWPDSGSVGIFFGTPEGQLRLGGTFPVGASPSALAVADFNRDGIADLAVANLGSNDVTILTGLPTGEFRTAATIPAGHGPSALAVADFNEDGVSDLAVWNRFDATAQLLLSDTRGEFHPGPAIPGVATIAAGRLLGRHADLLVAGADGRLRRLPGMGNGSFTTEETLLQSGAPGAVAIGDFQAAGHSSVAMVEISGALTLLPAQGAVSLPQSGSCPAAAVTVSLSQYTVTQAAGTDSITITGLPSCASWTASPFVTWIHVTSAASGNGAATISLSYDADLALDRAGTVVVSLESGGSTLNQVGLTITQDGPGGTGTLSPTSNSCPGSPVSMAPQPQTEDPGAGNDAIAIVGLPACATWTAVSQSSWIHIAPANASGNGAGSIPFSYDANLASTRTGTVAITISVAGSPSTPVTQTITQASPGYVVAPISSPRVTGLTLPLAAAVDPTGNAYVADASAGVVVLAPADGSVPSVIATGLQQPAAVAVDGSGDVQVATATAVAPLVSASSPVPAPAVGLPTAVAYDALGNLYIADNSTQTVKKYVPSTGVTTTVVTEPGTVDGIAVMPDGSPVVLDKTRQLVIEYASGQAPETLLTGAFNGVSADASGNVFATRSDGSGVAKRSPDAGGRVGGTVNIAVPNLSNPNGIAVDSNRNLYIADTGGGSLVELELVYVNAQPQSVGSGATAGALAPVLPVTASVAAQSDSPWLTLPAPTAGIVNYQVAANSSAQPRTAHIAVLNQIVTVTQSADTAVAIAVKAGSGQSVTVGASLQPLQAIVTDASGNPVSGVTVTFLSSQTAVTNSLGIAALSGITAPTLAGPFTVTASVAGVTPVATFSETAVAGPPNHVIASSAQSTPAGTAFPNVLSVTVADSYGNGVPGLPVTFAAPSSGASVAFASSPGVVTNLAGQANSPSLHANPIAGSYTVVATVSGLPPISFSLTNTPAPGALTLAYPSLANAPLTLVGSASFVQNGLSLSGPGAQPGPAAAWTAPLPTSQGFDTTFQFQWPSQTPSFALTIQGQGTAAVGGDGAAGGGFLGIQPSLSIVFENLTGVVVRALIQTGPSSRETPAVADLPSAPSGTGTAEVAYDPGSQTVSVWLNSVLQFSAPVGTLFQQMPVASFGFTGQSTSTPTIILSSTTLCLGQHPTLTALSGGGQTAVAGNVLGSVFQVAVAAPAGSPAGIPVTFAPPSSGPSGAFLGNPTVVSDASGIVSSPRFVSDEAPGSFTVSASAPGSAVVTFPVTTVAPPTPPISYPQFTAGDPTLTLDGAASVQSNSLLLGNSSANQAAALWLATPQYVSTGFSASLQFQIASPSEGIAFVIQNSSANALGGIGENLGFGGISNSLAVKFDTHQDLDLGEPAIENVGIFTRLDQPNSANWADNLASSTAPVVMDDNTVHTAFLYYDPPSGTLVVTVDGKTAALANVSSFFSDTTALPNGVAWVGLTSAAGNGFNPPHVLTFSFTSNGAPPSHPGIGGPPMTLVAPASLSVAALQLTAGAVPSAGAAWTPSPFPVSQGFVSAFQFQIAKPSEGFAFVIQNSSPTAVGASGGSAGFGGIPNSLAVKFDTNPSSALAAPFYQTAGIFSNFAGANSANWSYQLAASPAALTLDDGLVHNALVVYNPSTGILSVTVDGALAASANASAFFGNTSILPQGLAWIGFTSSTGVSETGAALVLSWVFENPNPPLEISGGGSDQFTMLAASGALTSDSAWLSIASQTSPVSFTFQPNAATAPRTATLSLAGFPIRQVTQAGLPASLTAVSGGGQAAVAGSSFPAPLIVQAKDAAGNPAAGVTLNLTVTPNSPGVATTAVTDATGTATFAGVKAPTVSGAYTITIGAPGTATPVTFLESVTAGPALTILQSALPSLTAGVPGMATFQFVDVYGNLANGGVVQFATVPGPTGATASLASASVTVGTTGLAIANLTPIGIGTFTLAVTVGGVSTQFTMTTFGGAATQIALPTVSNGTAGTAIALQVLLKDQFGDITGVGVSSVSLASSPAGFTASATPVNGVATFSVTLTAAGSYKLTASAAGLSNVSTNSFTIAPAAAATLTASGGGGQTSTVGTPFAAPLSVTVADSFGNPVSGAAVTFAGPAPGGATATLSGASSSLGSAGIQAAANTVAGSYTVTATLGSLSAHFTLTNTAAAASQLVFGTAPPAGGFAGTSLPAITVTARDSFANPTTLWTGSATLASAPATVSMTATPVNGVATFSGVMFAKAGSYTLTASETGLTSVTSGSIAIVSGVSLVVTDTLSRDPATNDVLINLTISNTGGATATGVQLTAIKLGSASAEAGSWNLGDIAAGAQATLTARVAAALAGASNSAAVLTVTGTWSGGTVTSQTRVLLP
jgi:adhesin/invasin